MGIIRIFTFFALASLLSINAISVYSCDLVESTHETRDCSEGSETHENETLENKVFISIHSSYSAKFFNSELVGFTEPKQNTFDVYFEIIIPPPEYSFSV
tara:strand:- start:62127 stop:62426 length:300 start_codon:yes stop_codon:yes gene_type:complete